VGIPQRFNLSKGVRETLSNIGWVGSDRLIRMGGGVIVGIAVARYLGPSNFGLLNYGLAIYAIFNILSTLGLDLLVVRDVVLIPEAEDEILGTSFLLKVLASFVTTAAAIAFTAIAGPHDTTTVKIVALVSFAAISQGFDVVDYFLQAKTRSRFAVVPKYIVFVAASVARLVAVFAKLSVLAFAWIAALEILFAELSLGFAYFLYHKRIRPWKFNRARAASFLRESWPLMFSSLLIMIYMRTDQILLGILASPATVGQYSAAVKISEIWYSIPAIICASVMPRLLKHRDSNLALYTRRLQRLYDAMAASSLVLAILISFVGRYLILLIYGHKYADAAGILAVHVWSGVFVFLGVVGAQQMIYESMAKMQLQRSAVGAVVNVGLNFLLIPRFGGLGSAIATLIAQGLAAYVMDFFSSRTRHIFWMKTRAYLQLWLFDNSWWRREEVEA
jgi:O-antigen/teichoic acid export membrane protein